MNQNGERTTSFERILFGFTRGIALAGSLVAIVAAGLILVNLLWSAEKKTQITYDELRPNLQPVKNASEKADTVPADKIVIPENVKKYFSVNENEIVRWTGTTNFTDLQDYLRNLSIVIEDAEKKNDNVFDILSKYKAAKLKKLQKTQYEEYQKIAVQVAQLATVFGLVLFIGLMSLILVMLAVERNTRKSN